MRCLDCRFFKRDDSNFLSNDYEGWCTINLPPIISREGRRVTRDLQRGSSCDLGQAIALYEKYDIKLEGASIIEKIIDRKTSEGRGG